MSRGLLRIKLLTRSRKEGEYSEREEMNKDKERVEEDMNKDKERGEEEMNKDKERVEEEKQKPANDEYWLELETPGERKCVF